MYRYDRVQGGAEKSLCGKSNQSPTLFSGAAAGPGPRTGVNTGHGVRVPSLSSLNGMVTRVAPEPSQETVPSAASTSSSAVMPSVTETKARAYLIDLYRSKPCMPIMVRLAWHDAGTFCAKSNTGGATGSIRFEPEISHGANAGLKWAVEQMEGIKAHVPEIGYADLFQLASVVAIEFTGGPAIPFRLGRKDATEVETTPDGRLPDAKQAEEHLRDIFYRMGFVDREIVALSGAHALGRAHADRSGFEGPWTKEPLVFDNSYFKELLAKEADPSLLKLKTDLCLLDVPSFRRWVEAYAADEQLFFKDYAAAHLKLSELGQFQN